MNSIVPLLQALVPVGYIISRAVTKAKIVDLATHKPGYKTTEFWVTVITIIGSAIEQWVGK